MSDKRGKKRPKSYYIKCSAKRKKINELGAGMKGFLITCNSFEKEAVREMYNILNEYADERFGPEVLTLQAPKRTKEKSAESSEDDDLEKVMTREAAEIKQVSSPTNVERRFQNTDTRIHNCIFIRTTLDDPVQITHDIFTEIMETGNQKARYALRMIPVEMTCKTNMENIKRRAEGHLKKYFETDFGVGLKFVATCKVRSNAGVQRHNVISLMSSIVQELNPLHTVCYDEPDLTIVVEVIRSVVCLSVVKNYKKFRRFNLHEILKTNDEKDKTEKTAEATASVKTGDQRDVTDDVTESASCKNGDDATSQSTAWVNEEAETSKEGSKDDAVATSQSTTVTDGKEAATAKEEGKDDAVATMQSTARTDGEEAAPAKEGGKDDAVADDSSGAVNTASVTSGTDASMEDKAADG